MQESLNVHLFPSDSSKERDLRILQIFSRYREYGGEEGSVYRIADVLHKDFDVGFFLYSTRDMFTGGALQSGAAVLKVFSNW